MTENLKNIFKTTEYITDDLLRSLEWKEDDYFGKYTTVVMNGKTFTITNIKGTFTYPYNTGKRYHEDEVPILGGTTYYQPIRNIGILEKVKIVFKNDSKIEEEYTEETQNYFSWGSKTRENLISIISHEAIYLNFPFLNEKMNSMKSLTYNLQLPLFILPYQEFRLFIGDKVKDLVDSVVLTHKNVCNSDIMDTIGSSMKLGKPKKYLNISGGTLNLGGEENNL